MVKTFLETARVKKASLKVSCIQFSVQCYMNLTANQRTFQIHIYKLISLGFFSLSVEIYLPGHLDHHSTIYQKQACMTIESFFFYDLIWTS